MPHALTTGLLLSVAAVSLLWGLALSRTRPWIAALASVLAAMLGGISMAQPWRPADPPPTPRQAPLLHDEGLAKGDQAAPWAR